MTDENVVDFPTTQTEEETPMRKALTPEQVAQMEEKGATKVLELIDKNKAAGISQLQNAVAQQDNRPRLYVPGETGVAHLENTVRALEKGIGGALTVTEALNSLVDMIRHDIVAMVQNLQQIQQAAIINNTQVNVLLNLLDEKGVINEADMSRKFRELAEKQAQEQNKD